MGWFILVYNFYFGNTIANLVINNIRGLINSFRKLNDWYR
jgi:hypothetical protein